MTIMCRNNCRTCNLEEAKRRFYSGEIGKFGFSGILGFMFGGFVVFKVRGALRIDWIGKRSFNVFAVAGLIPGQ
ncbi:MAG: hypothetical protein WA872_18835 [Candidatus Sulfotelmatobacter sp.]